MKRLRSGFLSQRRMRILKQLLQRHYHLGLRRGIVSGEDENVKKMFLKKR